VQCYSNVRLICYEYSDVVSHYLAPIYCCLWFPTVKFLEAGHFQSNSSKRRIFATYY
jgi:hypothetical protein